MPDELTCAVVVPSYRRPDRLCECLAALLEQEEPAAEIVVVAHRDDLDTQVTIAAAQQRSDAVRLVTVDRPGLVLALEAGARDASADIVAFTDDDARPRPDWLARLREAFLADSEVAGVGGRDDLEPALSGYEPSRRRVGKVAWFGRVTGNHHAGVGPPREVDVLKGVNCAYRREALSSVGFDHRLRGQVQHYNELALGLALARKGERLIYDPAIRVEHREGTRFDTQRVGGGLVEEAVLADAAYNEALALIEHLAGLRKWTYVVWSSLIGHRDSPGLVQAVRFTPALGRRSWRRWRLAGRARREARRLLATSR